MSDAAADPIRAIVGPDVPVTLVPNGIDVDRWRIPHVAGDPQETRVVAVMRLAPRKRSMALVRMGEQAAQQLPAGRRLRLTIVGDGPLRGQVEKHVRSKGFEHGRYVVDVTGRLTPDGVRATLAASDAFVAPALMESFGIAALEARTAGLPVLAYAATGIRSFVRDGREGLLARDDDEMVANLARLATDDALREQIAEHNRTTQPAQAWPNVLRTVEETYARAATTASEVPARA